MDTTLTETAMARVADLPQELIDDAAIGTEELPYIFNMYGYSTDDAEAFRVLPEFQRIVALRKKEIDDAGELDVRHAKLGRRVALASMINKAKDPNTAASVLSDYYKAFTAVIEPKTAAVAGAGGPTFSITFNIPSPGMQQNRGAVTIDAHTAHDSNIEDVPGSLDEPVPAYLSKLNADLEYHGE